MGGIGVGVALGFNMPQGSVPFPKMGGMGVGSTLGFNMSQFNIPILGVGGMDIQVDSNFNVPQGSMPFPRMGSMFSASSTPYAQTQLGYTQIHGHHHNTIMVPGSLYMPRKFFINNNRLVGHSSIIWNPIAKKELPFIETLNLPDLTNLANDPIL